MPRGSYLYSLTIPLHLQQCIKFCWNVIKSGSSALTTASLSRTCGKLQDIKAALVNHSGRAMHVSRGVLSKMQRKAINTLRTAKSLSQGPAFLRGFASLPCDYRQAVNISGILASPLVEVWCWTRRPCLFTAQVLPLSHFWPEIPCPCPCPFFFGHEVLLHSSGWLWTRDFPASTSQMMGLQSMWTQHTCIHTHT